MSFRRRIALAAAAAVAIAVVLASLLAYLLTANQLRGQVDDQLRSRAHETGACSGCSRRRAADRPERRRQHRQRAERLAIAAKEAEGDTPQRRARRERASAATDDRAADERLARLAVRETAADPDQVRGYQQVVDADGNVLARSAPT